MSAPVTRKVQRKFAADYGCKHWTTTDGRSVAHPEVDVVCISLPNNLHEEAVLLCCKHKKAVITTKPLGRNAAEAKRMLEAVEEAGIFHGYLEDLVYTPKFLKAYESIKKRRSGKDAMGQSPGKRIPVRIATGFGTLSRPVVVVFLTLAAIV